jgi:hypothetical protein
MTVPYDQKVSGTATVTAGHPKTAALFAVLVLTCWGVVTSPSPFVVLASGVVGILMIALLWRPGEPPLLLIPVSFQFLSVAMKPIETAITGSSLRDLSDYGADLESAVLFGLGAIACIAIGFRVGSGRARRQIDDTEVWPFRNILFVALAGLIAGHLLDILAERSGGARQILLALSGIKWAGVFVLACWTLRRRQGVHWLAMVLGFEIVLGMSGFFADFRMVVFVLFGAATAAYGTLRARAVIAIGVGGLLAIVLGSFWSEAKTDYREFLNAGTGGQIVLQPFEERLQFLAEKVANFDGHQFADGFELLCARISYLDFTAVTMERVPAIIPHESGSHLLQAIYHVLTPRILFPDKAELPSDTAMTAYYTGVDDAVLADENTSISLGYLGELYVDFGVGGALLVVFLMAVGFGRCYRAIRDYPLTPSLINYGLCMMVALAAASFETALIKLIGSIVMVLFAAVAIQRWGWPLVFSNNRHEVARHVRANNED